MFFNSFKQSKEWDYWLNLMALTLTPNAIKLRKNHSIKLL